MTARAMTELLVGQSSASMPSLDVTNTSSPVLDQSMGFTWKSVAAKKINIIFILFISHGPIANAGGFTAIDAQ